MGKILPKQRPIKKKKKKTRQALFRSAAFRNKGNKVAHSTEIKKNKGNKVAHSTEIKTTTTTTKQLPMATRFKFTAVRLLFLSHLRPTGALFIIFKISNFKEISKYK